MSTDMIIEEWRDLWTFKADYLLVALAYVFSFHNLPSLELDVLQNGGFAYVIAYVVSLFVCCIPIIVMELAIGQLSGRAPVQGIMNVCPLFKGVGVGFMLLALVVGSILSVIAGYMGIYLVYLFIALFNGEQPEWMSCKSQYQAENAIRECRLRYAAPFSSLAVQNSFDWDSLNGTTVVETLGATQFYLTDFIQRMNSASASGGRLTLETPGDLVWRPIAANGVVWGLVFFAVCAGVRWLGKVCYFTVVIPLCLLFTVMVKALTLDGANEHIVDIFTSQPENWWEFLLEHKTWTLAFTRSIQAVGLCFGSYITMGSYNKRNNNMIADAWLLMAMHIVFTVACFLMSAGLTGWLQFDLKLPKEILTAAKDKNLDTIFSLHLTALSHQAGSTVWIALYFIALAFFILNTLYLFAFNVIAALEDGFLHSIASRCVPRILISFAVCCLGFALGIGYCIQTGPNAFHFVRTYLDLLPYWALLTFEIIAVAWFYCAHMLGRDIKEMLSSALCWCCAFFNSYLLYILPAVPIYVLVQNFWNYQVHVDHQTPGWVEPVGWVIGALIILPIPLFMLYIVIKTCVRGPGVTCWQKFKYTIISPLRYEIVKPSPPPRYTMTAPGYVLLPSAPLAEQEVYNDPYAERVVKVSNI